MLRSLLVLVRSLVVVGLLLAPEVVAAESVTPPDNQKTPNASDMQVVSQVGGPVNAVAVSGSNGFVGIGPRLVVLDVTDPAQPRRIGQSAPIMIKRASIGDIEIAGGFAYVAAGSGLAIYDIRQPDRPVNVTLVPESATRVAVNGQLLFTTYLGHLQIWGIADRAHPQLLSEMVTPNLGYDDYTDVTAAGNYAYVTQANAFNGVQVVDVTDPMHPVIIETLPIAGLPTSVVIAGSRLYVGARDTTSTSDNGGLHIIDASNPQALVETGFDSGPVSTFAISGRYTYVLDYYLPHSLRVIDCTNPQNPHEIGAVEIIGDGRELAATTDRVYVAESPTFGSVPPTEQGGLRIYDVTSPSTPTMTGFYDTLSYVYDVTVAGNNAYIAAGPEGFAILDMTDLNFPSMIGALGNDGQATNVVAISGTLAYAGESDPSVGRGRLRIIDISNPHNLHTVSYIELDDAPFGLQVIDGYAYLLGYDSFAVIDVSNPQQPSAQCHHHLMRGVGLAVQANNAYLAHGDGMSIFDMSDPVNCPMIGSIDLLGDTSAIDVEGNRAYVGQSWIPNGLHIFDISDPHHPQVLGFLATQYPPYGVEAIQNHVYATNFGLLDIDVRDPSNPIVLGQLPLPGWPDEIVIVDNSLYIAASYGGLIVAWTSPLATKQWLPLVMHRH